MKGLAPTQLLKAADVQYKWTKPLRQACCAASAHYGSRRGTWNGMHGGGVSNDEAELLSPKLSPMSLPMEISPLDVPE